MAELDFLPFVEGEVLTPAILNALVDAIADGTIFTSATELTEALSTMGQRLDLIEDRVTALEALNKYSSIREQFTLTESQATVALSKAPRLDSELLFLNGVGLNKDDVPSGFVGEYSLAGSTIALGPGLIAQIAAGDILAVKYDYQAGS